MNSELDPPRQDGWNPEDLEWLEEQIRQSGEGPKEQTAGPLLDPSADAAAVRPATSGEGNEEELDPPAIGPNSTSPQEQPPQQLGQQADEDRNVDGTVLTEGLSPGSGEEHPQETLPAVREEAGEPGFSPTTGQKQPMLNALLVSQLASSVPQWLSKPELVDDAVELYQKFDPQDGPEIVLAVLTVGLCNASMDGLDRAVRPGLKPEVRQMELKLAQSGAAQVTNLIKALQSQRGVGTHKVSVGSVNVNAGANAVVGTVAARRSDKED